MQSAPTIVSSSRVQWSTAPSCTDVRAPITMRLWSPRNTACGQIVDPGPMHDVADDRRVGVHERVGIDLRDDVTEGVQRHGPRK